MILLGVGVLINWQITSYQLIINNKPFGPILSTKADKLMHYKLCVSHTADAMIQLQAVPQINKPNQHKVSLLATHYTAVTYRQMAAVSSAMLGKR